jgi:hypothetical protein
MQPSPGCPSRDHSRAGPPELHISMRSTAQCLRVFHTRNVPKGRRDIRPHASSWETARRGSCSSACTDLFDGVHAYVDDARCYCGRLLSPDADRACDNWQRLIP